MLQRVALKALGFLIIAAIASAQQTGRLRGTIVDENGKPIPGVQVSASQTPAAETYTDAKGAFAFEKVPVGPCTLKLQLAGMPEQQRTVDILAGRVTTTTVELNLSRLLAVLETVTVTARKEEEQMQATPVSVSAITASTLAADRLDTVERVVQLVPNAVIDSAPSQYGTQLDIRGVQAKPITLAENGVGFYRNGQYLRRDDSRHHRPHRCRPGRGVARTAGRPLRAQRRGRRDERHLRDSAPRH